MSGQRTVGGKFNSIGGGPTQQENAALVVRLVGEIGAEGHATLNTEDRLFLDDTKFKLNQTGNKMFGWRQVERIVIIHRNVMMERASKAAAKVRGPGL